jgi:hypothetical protein
MRWISVLFLFGCGIPSGQLVDGDPQTPGTAGCPGPQCAEVCDDGIDNDGDFDIDCDDMDCNDSCDLDADNDGYDDRARGGEDCDDTDASINPIATEVCDGVDNNCDGLIDEEDPNLDTSTLLDFYRDVDGDGFGLTSAAQKACTVPSGASLIDGDCDDDDPNTYPGAYEVPLDCIDQDCDGDTGDPDCDPVYIGEFLVDDGQAWGNNPPVFTCLEVCASLFGGAPTDYACSTDQPVIDYQASSSTWGVGGCGIVEENYSLDQGGGYDCGVASCATSAYVSDNCIGATNYCFQYP